MSLPFPLMPSVRPGLALADAHERSFGVRLAAALALALPALLAAWAGGWVFALWVLVFGMVMAWEWHAIAYRGEARGPLIAHALGLAVAVPFLALGCAAGALAAMGGAALGAAVMATGAAGGPRWALLGVVYVTLPMLALLWLRAEAVMPLAVILWLFAVVWATDSAALLAGRTIGGPRLAPQLSPRKTWAGLGGGVAAAALVGAATAWLIPGASIPVLAGLSAILAVVSQLGDLTESAFKRRFGVKDSSGLIPGQGGVLDRVDGLIFAALAVAGLALVRGGDVLFVSGPQ